MKTGNLTLPAMALLVLAMSVPAQAQTPLGTAFTYQGRLTDAGSPATAAYDLEFKLFDASTGGSQVGSTQSPVENISLASVAVTSGLFTVTLDFGPGVFAGDARWLQIGVRPGGTSGAYTVLTPRQALSPAPNAVFSSNAGEPARGGVVTEVGGYRIHTFTSSSTFNITVGMNVDVLVVGGGGAGGTHSTTNGNGGGGGGGVIYQAGYAVGAGPITVTVGTGGGGVMNSGTTSTLSRVGSNGQNSVFGSLVAIGGGGGGAQSTGNGQSGGSGGGGASNSNPMPGNGTVGQGNAGGQGNFTWTGGGGGGAGSAGVDGAACGNCAPSGNGGGGFGSNISGTLQYYGGGGGGGGNSSERAGDGRDGGGRGCGTTSYYNYTLYVKEINATTRGSGTPDAIPNTGGGGGAGSYWTGNVGWFGSGSGGSGIVIVRYPIP